MNDRRTKDDLQAAAQFTRAIRHSLLSGSMSPAQRGLWSYLHTPLIGDDVMELSTFGAKQYRLHEVCGTLVDRWFDTGNHVHPTKQTYASYHYRVRPFCGSPEPLNWSNCEFCVLLDYNKWSQFAITHADRNQMTCFPERRWDALDERTWWWLAKAKEQEERTLYRTRDWFKNNRMEWVEDVGWVEQTTGATP